MSEQYILAIDEGTTSTRAIIFNYAGQQVASVAREFTQYFPKPGWVEHQAEEIWNAVQITTSTALINSAIQPDQLAAIGYSEMIRQKTGLVIAPYFSATKIRWILDHLEGAQERAEKGELLFGTIDTWLVWKLTRGQGPRN